MARVRIEWALFVSVTCVCQLLGCYGGGSAGTETFNEFEDVENDEFETAEGEVEVETTDETENPATEPETEVEDIEEAETEEETETCSPSTITVDDLTITLPCHWWIEPRDGNVTAAYRRLDGETEVDALYLQWSEPSACLQHLETIATRNEREGLDWWWAADLEAAEAIVRRDGRGFWADGCLLFGDEVAIKFMAEFETDSEWEEILTILDSVSIPGLERGVPTPTETEEPDTSPEDEAGDNGWTEYSANGITMTVPSAEWYLPEDQSTHDLVVMRADAWVGATWSTNRLEAEEQIHALESTAGYLDCVHLLVDSIEGMTLGMNICPEREGFRPSVGLNGYILLNDSDEHFSALLVWGRNLNEAELTEEVLAVLASVHIPG